MLEAALRSVAPEARAVERELNRKCGVTGDVTGSVEAHNKEVGSASLVSDDAWRRAGVGAVAEAVGLVALQGRAAPVAPRRLA